MQPKSDCLNATVTLATFLDRRYK